MTDNSYSVEFSTTKLNNKSVEFVNADHVQGLGVVLDALETVFGSDWSMVATKVVISADVMIVYGDACEFICGGLDEPSVIEDFDLDEDYWEASQKYEDDCAEYEYEISELCEAMIDDFKGGFDLDVSFVLQDGSFILSIPIKR